MGWGRGERRSSNASVRQRSRDRGGIGLGQEDSVEECRLVGRCVLEAGHSRRLVGRRIVIRREPRAEVGHRASFPTESWRPSPNMGVFNCLSVSVCHCPGCAVAKGRSLSERTLYFHLVIDLAWIEIL
jgi:hypothetical protein